MALCKELWVSGNLITFCEKIKFFSPEDPDEKESYSYLENYFINTKYTEINNRDLTATINLLSCILVSVIIYMFIKDWIEAKIDRFVVKIKHKFN
jgi:hypothetical protein